MFRSDCIRICDGWAAMLEDEFDVLKIRYRESLYEIYLHALYIPWRYMKPTFRQ
jgi:hypothetical protein